MKRHRCADISMSRQMQFGNDLRHIAKLMPFFYLKVDMPILTCLFFTFNWLTLTSEMYFVKFHPEVASCLLSRGKKKKYAPLGMRLLWKYIRNYFLVYQLISQFLLYLQKYKEFEAEILDLQSEKYAGFQLISKNILLPVEPWGMRMWSA